MIRIKPNGTGTLLRRDPVSGRLTFTAAMRALEEMIGAQSPDVLILDPWWNCTTRRRTTTPRCGP